MKSDMWCRVRKRDEVIRAGWVVKAIVICLFLGGSGAGYLWQKSQVHQLGKAIHKLERKLEALGKGNELLRQQHAVLSSPQMLERRVAQFGLDLCSPAPEQILRLKDLGQMTLAKPSRNWQGNWQGKMNP